MTERKRDRTQDRTQDRTKEADAVREGFGDDQGTRVGRPTPGAEGDADRRPDHLSRGFRLSGADGDEEDTGTGTGAGAEAAEGIHTTEKRDPQDTSALEDVDTGRARPDEASVDRAGSEPLGREREHESGYGGKGGEPKTSSDQREPLEPEGRSDA